MDRIPTHFELFDLPTQYEVDRTLLTERYRTLQASVHPDRFASATERERRISMQQATQVNEAFQTLRDPLLRARYLLELSGYEFDDQQHTTRDSAFLMEQMELREQIDGLRDTQDPHSAVQGFLDAIGVRSRALQEQFAREFEENSANGRQAAAQTLMKMQFFRKLETEVQEIEDEIADAS